MVSPIPYSSFKRVKLRPRPSQAVAVAVVALVVIALEPTATLLSWPGATPPPARCGPWSGGPDPLSGSTATSFAPPPAQWPLGDEPIWT